MGVEARRYRRALRAGHRPVVAWWVGRSRAQCAVHYQTAHMGSKKRVDDDGTA